MPKNVQTTVLLLSFHMLAKQYSKSFKLDFSSMWTKNFQMFKLDRENVEVPDCQHLLDHRKSKGIPEKHLLLLHWLWKTLDYVDHKELWKIPKEMGIPDHLTCLLRNLCAGQEATVRNGHGKTYRFKTGKGIHQSFILSPCLFNSYAEYIMQNVRLDESQGGIKISRRNFNNLRYADDNTLMAEIKELKTLLLKVKEEVEKTRLKLNIQKTKIMAPSPITSWQIEGGKVETVTDFIFLVFKITVDSDWSHEIKWCLLLGRKVVANLDSILKSRDITLLTKVRLVKAMIFPMVIYRCKNWAIKKAEHRRIGAFELWCWRRVLRVPWTSRRSNQSVLKEINPELEGPMLKLKLS